MSHLYAALAALFWTVFCVGVDVIACRLVHDEEGLALRPLDRRAVFAIATICAAAAAILPDWPSGVCVALCLGALGIAALRDLRDRVIWPELMIVAIVAELLARSYAGNGNDAAVGAGAFGLAAWLLVFGLQAFRIPQGFGDILPALLLGATFPMLTGVMGISIGFSLYAFVLILTRKLTMADRTVALGPGFAMTALVAIVLTTQHYG